MNAQDLYRSLQTWFHDLTRQPAGGHFVTGTSGNWLSWFHEDDTGETVRTFYIEFPEVKSNDASLLALFATLKNLLPEGWPETQQLVAEAKRRSAGKPYTNIATVRDGDRIAVLFFRQTIAVGYDKGA